MANTIEEVAQLYAGFAAAYKGIAKEHGLEIEADKDMQSLYGLVNRSGIHLVNAVEAIGDDLEETLEKRATPDYVFVPMVINFPNGSQIHVAFHSEQISKGGSLHPLDVMYTPGSEDEAQSIDYYVTRQGKAKSKTSEINGILHEDAFRYMLKLAME